MEPKISVVMPVYNGAQFLRESLDSVLNQSISDLEVLCTDDGSTDESLAILEAYSAKDRRVRVFCQENKGAGPARNLSLANAQGEFVVFLDSDDSYPSTDTLSQLYHAAKEHNCQVVAGYRSMLTEQGAHPDIYDPLYTLIQEHPEGILLSYSDVQYDFNYQCYCFKRSLLTENNITFPDYRRCQDPPFLVKTLIAAQQFYLLPISSYLYRWGHQNVLWNKRKVNDLIKAHIDLLQMSKQAGLKTLHKSVASRLERKYKDILVSCLNQDNLEMVALLVYANSITDFSWAKEPGGKERKSIFYASVWEVINKLPDVISVCAAYSEDYVMRCVEEIRGFYSPLPNADMTFLNSAVLCILAQLYDSGRPCYVRNQLAQFVVHPSFAQMNACCDAQEEVAQAKETLRAVILSYGYFDRLQMLKNPETHNCRCIFDSRTEEVPVISVIVPVFNVERYIAECLNSLISQTFKNIEIICVNDGSTDSSLEIVMEFAKNNHNFVILQQFNCGLSAARNSGLKYARGKYIHFLDSDDFMEHTAYEQLIQKALPNDLDLLFFDGKSLYEDDNLRREFPWYETGYISQSVGDHITDGKDYFIQAVLGKDFRMSACMYLVRRELIDRNAIRFLEGIVHEDNYFTYVCALLSERTSHLSSNLYYRRVCRGSITIREKKFRHAYGYYYSYMALRDFLDHASISPAIKDIASIKLIDMLKNARNEYEKITDNLELQYYLALPAAESENFYLMVVEPVQQMKAREKRRLALAKPEVKSPPVQNSQVKNIQSKGSLLNRWMLCCKDHGIWYTVKYSFVKLARTITG